ncbi:MAG: hypothetical protein J6Y01_03525, partial [Spirochaetales bacterium]|nr:hypothetical protein [Spirochaetales bacterium]
MDWTKSVGICLGATTMSIVEIEKDNSAAGFAVKNIITKEHEGDPKGTLKKYLDEYNLDEKYLAVTGRKFREFINIPSITEPEAVELSYNYLRAETGEDYDAVVSAGGETFMVYQMDKKGKISRVSAGNKCASGTGEFFMQQIRRMNVSVDEAIRLAQTSEKPHQLSGRCSVFCKSDCTHALNKGESIADVAAGLARMIANKIHALVVKLSAKKIMVVGGTARNDAVIKYVRELVDQVDVPQEAPYFEALGAAIWAFNNKQTEHPDKDHYFKDKVSSFTFQRPLKDFIDMVDFKQMPREKAIDGDKCIVGLDVGSTTTKAVLFRIDDEKIVGSIYLRTNGNPVEASRNCYKALLDGLNGTKVNIIGVGVTGSGRYIAGLHADTDGVINEIIAHARAAAHFDPEVDTIFEIGGQDAKYTFLTNSVASDYAMNEACSAGTGSFLEESAKESLGIEMEDIADIALNSTNPPNFSDQCAAFISSDINSAFQEGISREDIIAGLVYSICINYVNRVKGARQVGKKVFMQGGVCYNKAVPVAMAAITGKHIIVPPEPGLMGAYGVALEIENMLEIGLLQPKSFDLKELADRTVEYGQSFRCQDPKCDRHCEIAMIHVCGQKIPFGGACNKYYNARRHVNYDVEKLNHVAYRRHLLFNKYMQPRADLAENAITVGLNKSFHMNTLLPMYFSFFNELGCKIVMSNEVHQSAIDKGTTSFCLSGQIALGLFEDLLRKKPDYIFMPQIMEMHVSDQKEYRKEFQTVCMFVQGEPFYQTATFLKDKPLDQKPVMLTPALNFMRGFDTQEQPFVDVAVKMGFTAEQGRAAYYKAFETQQAFFKDMKDEGRRILAEIES